MRFHGSALLQRLDSSGRGCDVERSDNEDGRVAGGLGVNRRYVVVRISVGYDIKEMGKLSARVLCKPKELVGRM